MNYDIDDLIEKHKDKNLGDIIKGFIQEVSSLDALQRREQKGTSAYRFNQYRMYAGDFLFFLNTGTTPAGIGIEGLRKFLPIINNLVKKKQLSESVLKRFEK